MHPSEKPCEASRGDQLTQRWGLEDGGGLCPDQGSPLPAFSMSLFSRNFSVPHGVPVDFMGQPQQTNGEEKHPSGALLSSQNLISAQPLSRSAGRRLSCFNPLREGPQGLILDPPSSLPCLPTTHMLLSLPNSSYSDLHPTAGLSLPPPFAELPQRPQIPVSDHQQSITVSILWARHLVNMAHGSKMGKTVGMGLRQKWA